MILLLYSSEVHTYFFCINMDNNTNINNLVINTFDRIKNVYAFFPNIILYWTNICPNIRIFSIWNKKLVFFIPAYENIQNGHWGEPVEPIMNSWNRVWHLTCNRFSFLPHVHFMTQTKRSPSVWSNTPEPLLKWIPFVYWFMV